MQIDFFDIHKIHSKYQQLLDRTLLDSLHRGDFINGKTIRVLEDSLAQYIGVSGCVSCANGSDALTIALRALDLPRGSEIIIPSFNYVSAAESAANLGYQVVFCDVQLESFNTSLELIKPHISDQTKAVIVTHLFGQSISDMVAIQDFCQKNGLKLIEDNAQSYGATLNHQKTGTFGDLSTTSFFPTKNLGGVGDGGAIFSNNSEYLNKASMLKSHGQSEKYKFEMTGYNSRLDTLQADILLQKLSWLDESLQRRKSHAATYQDHLSSLSQLSLPNGINHSYNQYTLRLPQKERTQLRSHLQENGIGTMLYYPVPLHLQACFKDLKQAELPNSEELCKTCFSLPIHSGLDRKEISYICSVIKKFYD